MIDIQTMEEKIGLSFSDEQKPIIEWKDNPLAVIACAGSGKTTTIELNMLYKVLNYDIDPQKILCITFSKRAQLDMDERYDNLYQKLVDLPPVDRPTFTTFHALFKNILEYFKGYKYRVVSMNKYKYQLMQSINFNSDNQYDINELIESIGNYRSSLINTLESSDGLEGIDSVPQTMDFTYTEYKNVISTYLDIKAQHNEIDFEDMQSLLLQMLEDDTKRAEVIRFFNNVFEHVYIDEFQDISPIQHAIVDIMLNEDYKHFTVIGDDDQSIYKFRGSSSDFILQFPKSVLESQTLYLSTNYRCRTNILANVQTSIQANKKRFVKEIKPFTKGGTLGIVKDKPNFEQICTYIKEDVENKGIEYASKHFAVLGRTKFQLSLMADSLLERQIGVRFKDKSEALQMSKYYQEIFNVIKMIKQNDVTCIRKCAYKTVRGMAKKAADKIANEVEITGEYWFDILKRMRKGNSKLDGIERNVEDIRKGRNLDKLLSAVFDVLKDFYKNMSKKGSKNFEYFKDTINYLLEVAASKKYTYIQFVENEREKVRHINDNIATQSGIPIMTFHGSKGLEFENVYLIGVDNKYVPNAASLQLDIENKRVYDCLSNFEEERRLFYVACTRAKRKLFISYSTKRPSVFVHELKDMDNHRISTVLDAIDDKIAKYDFAKLIYNDKGSYTQHVTHQSKGYISKKLENQLKHLLKTKTVKNKKKRKDYKFN
ncbi:hypothetical protein BUY85_00550 [Staphylococcus equorum]|uniref:ATP-dependent helicase n=1 Tax=Staphylococcus equorum TaxID=246432 RepID=UPI000D1C4D06|nr:ATP-dependent helicase [Staphylococcus equorum]PTE82259.1 hypothetical protein BUY85_00550 [Staphylococcus equorum]